MVPLKHSLTCTCTAFHGKKATKLTEFGITRPKSEQREYDLLGNFVPSFQEIQAEGEAAEGLLSLNYGSVFGAL
jgi:hypothetical protein